MAGTDVRMIWRIPETMGAIRRVTLRNMTRAALFVQSQVVGLLSVGQPVRRLPSGRLIGLRPSRPGEPPHVLTGRLRQSVTHRVLELGSQIIALVGSNVVYARALGLGFVGQGRVLAPRPYLRPAVINNRAQIRRIISGG